MKKILHLLAAVAAVIIIGCSSGSTPREQLQEIEELRGKDFPVTSEQAQEVNSLTEEGKRLLAEGKTEESSEALAKAVDILKRAQDAYIFNKAD